MDDLGYSMVVYFPPEAPWAEVDALCDKIADLVMDTTGWDADVSGVAGNVWNDQ